MVLHADAITENCATGIRTAGIDGDDSDGAVFFAIVLRQLVDQRALARARRAGQADGSCASGMRKERFEQIDPARRVVLNRRDRTGERTGIAGTELVKGNLDVSRLQGLSQPASLKQDEVKHTLMGQRVLCRYNANYPLSA